MLMAGFCSNKKSYIIQNITDNTYWISNTPKIVCKKNFHLLRSSFVFPVIADSNGPTVGFQDIHCFSRKKRKGEKKDIWLSAAMFPILDVGTNRLSHQGVWKCQNHITTNIAWAGCRLIRCKTLSPLLLFSKKKCPWGLWWKKLKWMCIYRHNCFSMPAVLLVKTKFRSLLWIFNGLFVMNKEKMILFLSVLEWLWMHAQYLDRNFTISAMRRSVDFNSSWSWVEGQGLIGWSFQMQTNWNFIS